MNVCMLSSRFHPILGGAEQQAQRLSRSLRGRGINAYVVTCRYRGLPADEMIDDVPVHRIRTIYRSMEPLGKVGSLHMMASLFGYLLRNGDKIDIMHVHGAGKMAITANAAKGFIGAPVVVKVATASTRGTGEGDLHGAETAPLGGLRLSMLKRCDRFIATTRQIEGELRERGVPPDQIALIPNGVDTDRFTPAAPAEKIACRENLGLRGDTICLSLGRLIRRKGIDILLEAWKTVIGEVPGAVLVVAGSGAEENNLREIAGSRRLEQNIIFTGAVDPAELELYYRSADLFVLPSRGEGMPNTLLEAMSCGLPAVASAIGGVVDVITNEETGFIVPPGDHAALAGSIVKALSGNGAAVGARGREIVMERFSLDAVAERYADLYATLLDR